MERRPTGPAVYEITRKLAMLFEGQCEGLGPTLAAHKFGFTKQRYFQLLKQFEALGALALQSKARGPKTNYHPGSATGRPLTEGPAGRTWRTPGYRIGLWSQRPSGT
jgi:hypothetical protein